MVPAAWRPANTCDLIRLGSAHDGGYVVARHSVEAATTLLSLGVCDNWDFEEAFRRSRRIRIICFDHSVTGPFWAWYTLHGLVRLSWRRATKFLHYRQFFRGEAEHRRVRVAYDNPGSTSLDTILQDMPDGLLFLKVDIEGGEYRLLNDIVRHAARFSGLVIEFHDIDLHRMRISAFVQRLSGFRVVNVHGNNFGGTDENGDPLVLEMTFADAKYCYHIGPKAELNAPNSPRAPEIELHYSRLAEVENQRGEALPNLPYA
jgi:hypothetical protein